MKNGICKLTGDEGPLVKSHIIPKALTTFAEKGRPVAQAGTDYAPVKRWDSWYDATIVTRAGEDILEEYDRWGIDELRRHQLVWSSWGTASSLPAKDNQLTPNSEGWGVRIFDDIDPQRLRLFFLSILWRAAVSNMTEFREIDIRASDLRRLKLMIRDGEPDPLRLFPFSLTQLSTKGMIHNHTPVAQRKPRDINRPNGPTIPIFRFYFDGLIAHFHREGSERDVRGYGTMLIGGGDKVVVTTVPFEGSWQDGNLRNLIGTVEEKWPDRIAKFRRV